MYDQSAGTPKPVAATAANKLKLATWLKSKKPTGSTDPRKALDFALRMRPDGVFMLSDGKFNGHENQKKSSLTSGNSDAFSIVAASSHKTPIHAIAFEDRRSCENMQRLAEMSGGGYQFVSITKTEIARKALSVADEYLKSGDTKTAQTLLRKVAQKYRGSLPANQATERIASILTQESHKLRNAGDVAGVARNLAELVQLDQTSITIRKQQDALANIVAQSIGSIDDARKYEKDLDHILRPVQDSIAVKPIHERIAGYMVDEARRLTIEESQQKGMKQYNEVIRKYPSTRASQTGSWERSQLVDSIFHQTHTQGIAKGPVFYARQLRELATDFEDTEVCQRANAYLKKLARQMQAAIASARAKQDRRAIKQFTDQISLAFKDDPILLEIQDEAKSNEVKARLLFRKAEIEERRGSKDTAIRHYQSILDRYGLTFNAQKAKARLDALVSDEPIPDEKLEKEISDLMNQ